MFTTALAMSDGERLLIMVDHDLWTSARDVGIAQIARRLDARQFEVVLEALRMCRGAYPAPLAQWVLEPK